MAVTRTGSSPRTHTRRRGRDESSTRVRVSRVERGDLWVRVSTIGTTGERPFVLVPGIGVSSDYFERLAPNLNSFGPVHALDLPGFAGVTHPRRALTIRQFADLVGAAIDDLGLKDPIIVGHSMGTQIVTDLAARRPELSTLVLIGPVVNPAERRVTVAARRFLQAAWHEPGRVKVLALRAYLVCGVHWFSQVLPKMMTYPIERQLPKVRAHTLVIRGEHDAVAPRSWVEQIGRLVPSSRLWEMPGAAHSVMHAHAEEVARLCVEHAEQPPRPGEGDELRHYADAGDGTERGEFDFTPEEAAKAMLATVREGVAIARGDDDAIGQAKSDHAEAMLAAHDRAERRRGDEEATAGDEDADDARRADPDDRTTAS
ncbi:alpha/beta hydrolase [Frigoribacterium sp. ACAM 257]|uniref:alpha/beta fold hydrolase n=1 Tax=Frigoribacterium sp. ACAM 257 TaxID=2508998 RepID=UPI0011B9E5AC|nr:alpha/beta fold hydrolase [Frigoribacterium sp. ACAM 257]TWX40067.1 alpha/beta hydrolase [Frigoribacterium sp. ACAM 257]